MEWQGWNKRGSVNFCKFAKDRPVMEGYIIFLTDPEAALEYWRAYRFDDMVEWAESGYPGVHKPIRRDEIGFWILSPDSEGG